MPDETVYNVGEYLIVTGDTADLMHGFAPGDGIFVTEGPNADNEYMVRNAVVEDNLRLLVSAQDLRRVWD